MKLGVLFVCLIGSVGVADAGQGGRTRTATPPQASSSSNIGDAYNQYLSARRLERDDDVDGAIAAYKRAIALDPKSADVPAELAGLFLRQNRVTDAISSAEAALRVDEANAEAHRVLGTIYAA